MTENPNDGDKLIRVVTWKLTHLVKLPLCKIFYALHCQAC